jgi:hypothetical protein
VSEGEESHHVPHRGAPEEVIEVMSPAEVRRAMHDGVPGRRPRAGAVRASHARDCQPCRDRPPGRSPRQRWAGRIVHGPPRHRRGPARPADACRLPPCRVGARTRRGSLKTQPATRLRDDCDCRGARTIRRYSPLSAGPSPLRVRVPGASLPCVGLNSAQPQRLRQGSIWGAPPKCSRTRHGAARG